MFDEYNSHKLIRKYVVYFGNLFSGMKIERSDDTGKKFSTFEVPIAYGSKKKWFEKVFSDPDGQKKIQSQIPRLAFEMSDMSYDAERKLNSMNRLTRTSNTDANKFLAVWEPVPYNFSFALHILCQKFDDGIQIVENILPYFTPDFVQTLDLIPEIGVALDIPVVFEDISMADEYEGSFEDRQVLTFTLTFSLKGYIFGPVKKTGIIKTVQVDMNMDGRIGSRQERLLTIPGLTAAGQPTTDYDLAVNPKTVNAEDSYGIANKLTTYTDGLIYNPRTGDDEVP